ncbi:MAG: GNAT family N-acetyltransferase [Ruminococcaceae bacterium]|nr:GNAT family N-acetyltransferase [Oscillospiraceae bacterium]
MDIEYREAVCEDAELMLEHLNTVGGETDNLSYGKNTFLISAEKEAKFIDKFLRSGKDAMFVALCDGKIVGNAIVEHNKILRYSHRAEISLTVLREYWGRGIGSHLMQMMIDFARGAGIEILYLEVRADNNRALSVYRKFGFESIGIYKNFFKIGAEYFDACLMTLKT